MISGGRLEMTDYVEQQIQNLINYMNAHIKVHEAKEQEAINKAFQQEWMKSSHSWYDKIQSFTQIIVSIGYAGFFATINVCKNYLNPKLLALSSLFMLLSIFVFIINEIIAMKQRDSSMRSAFTVACVEPNKAIETFARFQIIEFELSKKRARRASFFFWVSVPAGVFAAGLLLCGIAWNLIRALF